MELRPILLRFQKVISCDSGALAAQHQKQPTQGRTFKYYPWVGSFVMHHSTLGGGAKEGSVLFFLWVQRVLCVRWGVA